MQVPRLFAVLFAYVTFWRPKKVVDLWRTKLGWRPFGVFLPSFWGTKKSCMNFRRPFFLIFGRQKVTKRTTKSYTTFFVPQFSQQPKKDSKKSPRSFWTAKGRYGEKDGKKLWHLLSAEIKGYAVALFSVNPTYSVNFMSVKVMLHCISGK